MGKIGRIDCSKDVPLTQQSAKDECDINLIVEKAKRGAIVSHVNPAAPQYGSLIGFPSFREALDIVTKAQLAFAALDARIRDRFANDPAKLVDFLQDSKNLEEAIALGLVDKPVVSAKTSSDADSTKAKPVGEKA